MHLRITQRLLQDEWMRTSDVGDPPLLGPAGGVLADDTQTAALALEVARERARDMVDRARRARRSRTAAAASSSWEGAPENDAAEGRPERSGDDADDAEEDSHSLMQLTRDEEGDLDNLAVDDDVRRCLRDLLRGLEEQENRDVGAEYRWGVQQVVEASIGAQRVMECVRNILRDRVVPSQAMRSWPCQRVPPFGPLRSRIGAWMAEYRWVVVQAFDRELGAALEELLGCPPASREPVGPATPAERGRATREPRGPPRGSRSRSPVVRSPGLVPGVEAGNVLSSTGVASSVETVVVPPMPDGDSGMDVGRVDLGVRVRPAPAVPGDPGVRADPGMDSAYLAYLFMLCLVAQLNLHTLLVALSLVKTVLMGLLSHLRLRGLDHVWILGRLREYLVCLVLLYLAALFLYYLKVLVFVLVILTLEVLMVLFHLLLGMDVARFLMPQCCSWLVGCVIPRVVVWMPP